MKTHSSIRGTIIYTSKKPERMNEERGREYFTLTRQSDQNIVMLAHCEIDDEPDVIRDVCMAMDKNSAPLDCSVRLSVGGKFEGTGWMRFGNGFAELETFSQRDGRITQRLDLNEPCKWLQSHPIVGDGLLMKLYDLSQGPGKQRFDDLLLTSPDHRGATGPQYFKCGFSLIYIGEEEVTVGAGRFTSRHFQLTDTAGELPEEHPPYDVWVTADDDYLLLKAGVAGYMQTHYELMDVVRD